MKIIVDDKIPFIRGRVERLADEVVYMPGSAIAASDVRDADALVVRTRTHCNRQLLEGSRVRFVVTATIGYDHFDTRYLDEAGIRWTNCPGCNATSVAQYVRNALLQAERRGLVCLHEATLGIVGYGHVGQAVYRTLLPYVERIVVNDPPLFENEKLRMKNEESKTLCQPNTNSDSSLPTLHASLDEMAASCDIITLHTPLTTSGPYPTRHLVDDEFLHRLPRHPLLVNAARGGVVDDAALERALDEGRIRQAIVDTWEGEPDIRRSLLGKVFVGTPHIAGYSADGKANATRMALEALAHFVGRDHGDGAGEAPELPAALPERTGLRYNPLDDSQRLKEDPEGFEHQRGNYPLRRE